MMYKRNKWFEDLSLTLKSHRHLLLFGFGKVLSESQLVQSLEILLKESLHLRVEFILDLGKFSK